MRAISTEFYGDDTRWFIGKVVTKGVESDPAGLGRVRVRIVGIHDDNLGQIPNSALPFASVVMPNSEGGTKNTTQAPMIQNDALVIGLFLDGETSQQPVIIGCIPHLASRRSINHQSTGERMLDQGNVDLSTSSVNSQSANTYKPGLATAIEIELLDRAGIDHNLTEGMALSADQAEILSTTVAGSGNISIQLVGEGQPQQTYNFLRSLFIELNHKNPGNVAAAFVGNFVHESGVQSWRNEDNPLVSGSRGGYGLAQWTGPRRRALEKFARYHRAYVGNLAVQLAWIEAEMKGAPDTEFYGSGFVSSMRAANTVALATEVVFAKYETPMTVVNFINSGPGFGTKFKTYLANGGIETRVQQLASISSYVQDYYNEYKKRYGSAIDAQKYGR
jgi:hypothetical protein